MNAPIITQTIGGWCFEWRDEGLLLKISRIHEHGDGRVTGELSIANLDNRPLRPPDANFNFTSELTRTKLIKNLSALSKDIKWQEIIDYLCVELVERVQAGSPVEELWTSDDVAPIHFILEPLVLKGVPTIIFGEKGAGKSTIAQIVYICLSLPWTDNPLGLKIGNPDRVTPTLILDYELPGYIAQRNAKNFQEGMGLPAFPLYHRKCTTPLAQDIEAIAEHIAKLKAEVIIIDSLARACGGDLIKTEPANDFFEALDKLKVTPFIIAQTSKDPDTKRKTIYGNALFTYYARSIFEICRSENLGDSEINIALFHRWSNLTRLYPDMGFKISYNGAGTHIECQDVSITEFMQKVSTQKAVMDALKSGAMSVKELKEVLGITDNAVRVALTRLKKKKAITLTEDDKWGLLYD